LAIELAPTEAFAASEWMFYADRHQVRIRCPLRCGVSGVLRALRGAFPDLNYQIEDVVVGDQAVAVRTTLRGTHRGSFFGLPATGKRVEVSQMTIERFADGKIVEHHRVTDELALRQQLGVLTA